MSMFMVGVDRWLSAFSILLHEQEMFQSSVCTPSFSCLPYLLFLKGWLCEGHFFRPRMHAASKIGANEVIQVLKSGEATPLSMIVHVC